MTEELRILFYEKLNLGLLSSDVQTDFFKAMDTYLSHGRTYEYVVEKLDCLLEFLEAIGIGSMECAIILINFPAILNIVDELYPKYLFLGIIENEDNSYRRKKFFSKTKDYRVSLHKIYARYVVCKKCGYEDIKWNTLVHATDAEFAKIFVVGTYRKPYQFFSSVEEVIDFLGNVDISELDIDQYKDLDVNKEIVARYENKGKTM